MYLVYAKWLILYFLHLALFCAPWKWLVQGAHAPFALPPDQNLVTLLTTVHTTAMFNKQTRSHNSQIDFIEWQKPLKAIELYTNYMRGVDLLYTLWYSLNTHKSVQVVAKTLLQTVGSHITWTPLLSGDITTQMAVLTEIKLRW